MPIPLLASLAISQVPSLLSLFSGRDPQARQRSEMMQQLSPEVLQELARKLFGMTTSSPGYRQARANTVGGYNNAVESLNHSLGERGLAGTGLGLMAASGARAGLGGAIGGLEAGAWDNALGLAERLQTARAGVLRDVPYGPSRFQTSFGKGIEAFMPILRDYINNRLGKIDINSLPFDKVDAGAF